MKKLIVEISDSLHSKLKIDAIKKFKITKTICYGEVGKMTTQGRRSFMNEELLKMAQAEYQRQYDDWLQNRPNEQDIINNYIKMKKYIDKFSKKNEAKPQ